ncbi:MAG: hydrogenase maturation nickel metallochaperone HypA [candidate division WOR-3 bacterium]|nr:hydrogenase maturation nickel metallochaperone HypA [candidate division WOR-3 bacterium]
MHEFTITQSILNQVLTTAQKHKAKRINKIKLQIGEGSAIIPECVRFYFDQIKIGTIAENAILDFEKIPVKVQCPQCKKEFLGLEITCNCQKGVEVVSGQEMIIEYIDIE